MHHHFDKKIYSLKLLLSDLWFFIVNLFGIIGALRNKTLSRAFVEKIMLVITAVNKCTYCTWFHAKLALNSGISAEEIQNMLKLQFHTDATEHELVALLYAQHFAETHRNPDVLMTDKLESVYGRKTAKHVMIFIRFIYFGNLSGNTFDAFLSRLKDSPAPQSNPVFECLFFLVTWPIYVPAWFLSRKNKS